MEKLKPLKVEFSIQTVKFQAKILDGVCSLTASEPTVIKNMYKSCLEAGKPNISYNERLNAMIELFHGLKASEIKNRLLVDVATARNQLTNPDKEFIKK